MNMKRILPLLLSLAMALALCACGSQSSSDGAQTSVSGSTGVEDGVLTVGMECAYAPYNWTQIDDSNNGVAISNMSGSYANGYDVMISKIICDIYGWELEVVSSAWDSLVPGVQSGIYDAVIAGQSMTCLPQIPDVDLIAPAETAPSMIMSLTTGQVDYICTDVPTATAAVQKDDNLVILNFAGTDGDFQFASEEERAENVNIGISVRKGNTVLKDAIDKVLSQMTEDDFNQLMDEAIRIQPEV